MKVRTSLTTMARKKHKNNNGENDNKSSGKHRPRIEESDDDDSVHPPPPPLPTPRSDKPTFSSLLNKTIHNKNYNKISVIHNKRSRKSRPRILDSDDDDPVHTAPPPPLQTPHHNSLIETLTSETMRCLLLQQTPTIPWFSYRHPSNKVYPTNGPPGISITQNQLGVEQWKNDFTKSETTRRFFPSLPFDLLHAFLTLLPSQKQNFPQPPDINTIDGVTHFPFKSVYRLTTGNAVIGKNFPLSQLAHLKIEKPKQESTPPPLIPPLPSREGISF